MNDIESNQNYQQLQDEQHQDEDKEIECEDPIQQYNIVVENYNKEVNIQNGIEMQKMEMNKFLSFVLININKALGAIILLFSLLLLTGINVFLYIALFVSFFLYRKQLSVYSSNQKKVQDPFKKMVLSPEMCQMVGSNHHYFDIPVKQVEGFSINMDVFDLLKTRENNGNVQFMIYNRIFADYYTKFPKYNGKLLCWIISSTILVMLNAWITYVIINGYNNKKGN